MIPDDSRLLEMAEAVLASHRLERGALTLIRRRGNATFRVEHGGRRFVLRLHLTGAPGCATHDEMVGAIGSELCWLDALARDAGLAVPVPVRTSSGAWVATLEGDDGQRTAASLLTWVEGTPWCLDRPEALVQAKALGDLLARLHRHGEAWTPPPGFRRPTHDARRTTWIADLLRGASKSAGAQAEEFAVMRDALDRIREARGSLPRTRSHWGLLHGDVYPANVIVLGARAALIDFSLCGFGHYLQDVASCRAALEPPLAAAFMRGYAAHRAIEPASLPILGFLDLETRLGSLAVALGNPASDPPLRRTVVTLASLCRRLVDARVRE